MRTAFLAGGNAVVAPALIGDVAIIGDGPCLCSTVTGLEVKQHVEQKKKTSVDSRGV